MTTDIPEDSGEKPEKPVLPTRILGPLEREADAKAEGESDKNLRYTYSEHLEAAIDRLGREQYEEEVANSYIDQALLYINMTREEVEATGHQPGALLPKVALGKTPSEIREWLSRPPETTPPTDPKVIHMELAQRALERSRDRRV